MKRSYLLAAAIAIAAVAWIGSGQIGRDDSPARATAATEASAPIAEAVPTVRVRTIESRTRLREIVVNGRAEAVRIVEIKAETAGRVTEVPAGKGALIRAGTVIARLAIDERNANLAEARALLRQREVEHEAATQLAARGFRPEIKVSESRAQLDAARARVSKMEVELGQTVIKAPFDSVLDERFVELGDYVKAGDRIAKVVDLNPALVIGFVSEREIGLVTVGAPGGARISSGATATGTVRYKAAAADPATRTFRVELEVANPDLRLKHGQTAELRLPVGEMRAHLIAPAILSLDEAGEVGVKIVDADSVVRFVRVRVLGDAPDGIWVDGLPDRVTVITVGHEFVTAGRRVQGIDDGATAGRP